MNFRRSVAAGTLALTTLVTAGPLAAAASAQTDPAPSSTVPAVDCNRVGNRFVRTARRLNVAQNRLAFWQRVAAEMPARIDAQNATVADLETQLAAATGDAATALQTQLDQAREKLAWMQAKLDASARRVPFWTDYVAKVTARLTTISDTANGATCTLPTTTTIPFDTSLPAGERPPHAEGREHRGEDGSTTTVDPNAPSTTEDRPGNPEDEHPEDRPHGTPNTTVPGNAAAQAQAQAARRAAEAQRRAAERLAEAQRRAAEGQRRNRGGQQPGRAPGATAPSGAPAPSGSSDGSGESGDD